MRSVIAVLGCLAAAIAVAQPATGDDVIVLKDGDRVVVRADGTMTHLDAGGNAVAMPEGVIMTTREGRRIVMKNRSLWLEIAEIAATSYARAQLPPGVGAGETRTVALADGGRIVIAPDGSMTHFDAAGRRIAMADGVTMVAKDGRRIVMGSGSLWSTAK